ncbi:MAG: PAS domain S-box protein [Actinomycetota bacterium]
MMDAMPVGVFVTDAAGKPYFANQAAQQILGEGIIPDVPPDRIGEVYNAYIAGTNDRYPADLIPVVRALNGETVVVHDLEIHRQEMVIPVDVWAAPIYDMNGELIHAIAAFRDVTERKRAEAESRVISEIAQGIATTANLDELLELIYQSVKKVVYAENFYVALYDRQSDLINIPFCRDQYDTVAPPQKLSKGLTAYAFHSGRPALLTKNEIHHLIEQKDVDLVGTLPAIWLGIPLRTPTEVIGVLVVQHYEDAVAYTERDVEILTSASNQIAVVIERQRDVERLLEQRDFTSAITNSVGEGIYVIDFESRVTLINPAAEIMLGWKESELLGKNIHEAIHFQRADETPFLLEDCPLAGVLRTGQSVEIEDDVFTRRDGSALQIAYTSSPIITNKKVTGAVVSFHDITEQKAAQRKLFTLASIVESSVDAILSQTLEGKIISWNAGAEKLYGYSAQEILGQHISVIYPSDRIEEESAIISAMMHGERLQGYETVRSGKGHKNIPVSLTVSPVRDRDGRIIGISKIAHDITERKRIEEELKKTRDSALESARLKSEFLANMSHEIRTPMNGVIGMTGLLLNSSLDTDQKDYAETIQSSADSLLRIIDDILDFSKIEAGQMQFEKIDFDLNEAVEGAVEMLAERSRVKEIELASLIYRDVPTGLRSDPGRLRQVLTNLIGNALKFTERGEVIVSVQKESETNKFVSLRFEVADTGIGISDEARKNLFQAFVQADGSTTRKYGGTGLGLAISKQLVEMMGGEIGLRSELGKGSVFWFTARFEKQVAPAVPVQTESEASLEGLRVLIVDDNATNRKILVHQTASWGMAAIEAKSGAEALSVLHAAVEQQEPFDIAILDLMMPEMNGFELAQRIKAEESITKTHLVLMPSYGKRGHGRMARDTQIAAYLQKPVRQSQLYKCLKAVIAEASGNAVNSERQSQRLITRHSLRSTTLPVTESNVTASIARILVAEDNPVNQKVALSQLKSLGFTAEVVTNGRAAVEAVENQRYDIVLMDCQMPEMDGFEATAAIRRHEGERKHTTIIAMTAHALEGEREKCLAAGMDDYISKPVKIDTLKQTLERWIFTTNNRAESISENSKSLFQKDARQVIDLSILSSLRDLQQPDEPDLVTKLIDLFIKDGRVRLQSLQNALIDGDSSIIKKEAHSVQGSAANIGAQYMARLCEELEQKANQTKEAEILITQLDHEFGQVIKTLNLYSIT